MGVRNRQRMAGAIFTRSLEAEWEQSKSCGMRRTAIVPRVLKRPPASIGISLCAIKLSNMHTSFSVNPITVFRVFVVNPNSPAAAHFCRCELGVGVGGWRLGMHSASSCAEDAPSGKGSPSVCGRHSEVKSSIDLPFAFRTPCSTSISSLRVEPKPSHNEIFRFEPTDSLGDPEDKDFTESDKPVPLVFGRLTESFDT
ncbi:hypothetical protein AGDE_14978 [Angomonas deanei]|nr:hypothetical protein AGDE_14978 [Angomonas deanei]|eukprot:EPY19896.1 hypothetical protein AGDE_14978 [Angomonas deanei]